MHSLLREVRAVRPPSLAPESPSFLRLATRRSVVRRGLMYAAIVGTVLITINHGDAILRGDLTTGRVLKMGLTVFVPYIVSTLSSVGTLRSAMRGASVSPPAS